MEDDERIPAINRTMASQPDKAPAINGTIASTRKPPRDQWNNCLSIRQSGLSLDVIVRQLHLYADSLPLSLAFPYLTGTRRKCLSVWPPYQLVTACQYPASENHVSPN